jgi:hypothetical protein
MFILRLGIFLCLWVFTLVTGFAQSDFRSGYIVTTSQDTIQGLLDYQSETKNARQVYFKRTQSAEPAKYESTDLLAYGFTGSKMYESKKIKLDNATTVIAFLELLVKGKISLYHLKDDERFYIEKAEQEIMPLFETKVKVKHENGTDFIETRKIYLGVLNNIMADCPGVQKAIRRTKLDYSSLMDLVNVYNNFGIEKKSLQTKRKFLILKKGVLVGAQTTSMRFTTIPAALPEYEFLTRTDFPADIQPFGGIFINSTFPWITEKVSIQLEAQFLKAHYYSNTQHIQYNAYTIHDEFTINLNYLRFPVLFRYSYPKGKLRPYIQAGILNDFVLNKKVHLISEQQTSRSVSTSERSEMNMRNYSLYGTLGAGILHPLSKKLWLSVEVRGAMGNNMRDPVLIPRYKARNTILSVQTAIGF